MANGSTADAGRLNTGKKPLIFNRYKAMRLTHNAVNSLSHLIATVLKAMATVVMIIVTTIMFFGVIFAVYVKTNLSGPLDFSLEEYQLNLSSTLYTEDSYGELQEVVNIQNTEYRLWADFEEIPIDMQHALVAIEDKRFYTHHGVDWYRTVAAFGNMFIGMKNNFGGSTITQQLIKNITGEDEATVTRKLQEIFRALEFERQYSKNEIITYYMNEVNFGGTVYGVAAAADYYFGKTLSELTLAESASIIGITNNPSKYNPYLSSTTRANNKARQEEILKAMYNQEYITLEQYNEAVSQELVFKRGENSTYKPVIYDWFTEACLAQVITDLAELNGTSKAEAEKLLYRGGYTIIRTMDQEIQDKMESVYEDLSQIPATTGSKQQLQSAMVIMDPYTGYVKGIVGGVGEKTANLLLNRATSDSARRPIGSSVKPLAAYSLALEMGLLTPDTIVNDTPDYVMSPDAKGWYPKNADRAYQGAMTVREAIVRSRNTIAAQVVDQLTPAVSYDFLTNTLGIKLVAADEDYAPMSIGQFTYGATVLEMASAYTMFPNMGIRMAPILYTKVLDHDGKVIIENKPKGTIAISEKTAYWMTSMMQSAVERLSAAPAKLDKMPSAGKTGTTDSNKDLYFIGYTPYYVCAAWSGYDTPEVINISGGNPSARLFKKVMELVHAELPYKNFTVPTDISLTEVPTLKEATYTISYLINGAEFLSISKYGKIGGSITVEAEKMDGYVLVGESTKTITLNADSSQNIITFNYTYAPGYGPTPTATPDPGEIDLPADIP